VATQSLSVLTHVSGVTVDVEYDNVTNALAMLIVSNPQGRVATLSITVPVVGDVLVNVGVGSSNQRVVIAAGAVWKSVTNLGGATSLCWPDGWGFQASVG